MQKYKIINAANNTGIAGVKAQANSVMIATIFVLSGHKKTVMYSFYAITYFLDQVQPAMSNHIPALVKWLREKKNLTREELARELGVSHGFIGQLERGVSKLSYEMMSKLINKYNIDANMFFGKIQKDETYASKHTARYAREKLAQVSEKAIEYAKTLESVFTEVDSFDLFEDTKK